MLVVAGRPISSIAVIDDDEHAREGYSEPIEEMDLEAIPEVGPLRNLDDTALRLESYAQAALCDHHLRKRNYASFNGATLVAQCYRRGFPAILCTNWEKASLDEIRRDRRRIPVLLTPSEVNPESLRAGMGKVVRELAGTFEHDRRPWRTLVRIEELVDIDNPGGMCCVVVPAWKPHEVISLRWAFLKPDVQELLLSGKTRFHADVNTGAETQEELFFDNWEAP